MGRGREMCSEEKGGMKGGMEMRKTEEWKEEWTD